jgi:hypothetical protein
METPFENNREPAQPPPPQLRPVGLSRPSSELPVASPLRPLLASLLSLCLALFVADAIVALAHSSLILFFDVRALETFRGFLFLLTFLMLLGLYGLIGLTPLVPKRIFLPLTLFMPVAGLLLIPALIYFHGSLQQIAWVASVGQLLFGLSLLRWVQGGFQFRWPLLLESRLGARIFSWRNTSVFLLANLFIVLPALAAYLTLCAALALGHFSEGFMALRPAGLMVQVRTYADAEGRSVRLVPMAHIGDAAFYRKLSDSFPENSIILMEGVSDRSQLLTNQLSYKRMATSIGLAEQQNEFDPQHGTRVMADLDVDQFSKETIDFLNMAMLIHGEGMTTETILKLAHYAPPPGAEQHLIQDLLVKRNHHLLGEIRSRLSHSDILIVPWGAAHMPEIARELLKSGFELRATEDLVVVRFPVRISPQDP